MIINKKRKEETRKIIKFKSHVVEKERIFASVNLRAPQKTEFSIY